MKKSTLLITTILASSLLVGGTFAAFAVTDNANPFGINITGGTLEEDTDTHYVTLSWGSKTSLANIEDMIPGSIYKLGIISLKSDLNYDGVFTTKLTDETKNRTTGAKRFIDYVQLYLYSGTNEEVEEGTLPTGTPLASTALGGTILTYDSARGNSEGKEYSLYIKFDNSAQIYIQEMEKDVVNVEVDWSPQEGDVHEDNHTIYFASDWNSCYLYTWGSGVQNAAWPGVQLTKIGLNQYGQSVYKGILVAGYDKMIFNNNSGDQTADVSISNFDYSHGDLMFWKEDNGVGNKVFDGNSDVTNYAVNMASNPGPILHAWGWTVNTVKSRLQDIKDAGYNAVQLSPLQPLGSGYADQGWYMAYQPVGMTVATSTNQNPLGTKSQLSELTAAADALGIRIIVDVVANHLAAGYDYKLYDGVQYYEPDIYGYNLIHEGYGETNDGSVQSIVRGNLGKLPDLQTETSTVQNRVISMLKEYIDCGVKGFRFDAAKHIETPNDGYYASQFWSNVIGATNQYGLEIYGEAPYSYGEILGVGAGRDWAGYTNYIDVTDYGVVWGMRDKFNNKDQNSYISSCNYGINNTAQYALLFAESHDNFVHGETNLYSDDYVDLIYGMHASRADSSALYYARPQNSERHGNDTKIVINQPTANHYNGPVVTAANKLHNDFEGGLEYLSVNNNCLINARMLGDNHGAYICDPSVFNGTKTVHIETFGGNFPDGTYVNTVTNEQVVVSGGNATVTFTNGVVVLEPSSGAIVVDHTVPPASGFAVRITRGTETLYYRATDTGEESYGKHVYRASGVPLEKDDHICMYDGNNSVAFNAQSADKMYIDSALSGVFVYNSSYLAVNAKGTYTIELQLASNDDSYYIYQ